MNLNSINIPYILKRLSCCITNLSSKMYGYSQIGNKDCFEDTRSNILILNSIYDILNENYTQVPASYKLYLNIPFDPAVCVCTIIDNTTGTILATGFNSGVVTIPTSIFAIGSAFNVLFGKDPCWNANFTFTKGGTKGAYTYSDVILNIENSCFCTLNISIHLYIPYIATPPYGGINTNIVATELGKYNLNNTFLPGSCTNKICFTQDQLNDLYQESLNLCKDCNCK